MHDKNNFGSRTQGFRFYEQFCVMDEMNNYESWAKGSRWYE